MEFDPMAHFRDTDVNERLLEYVESHATYCSFTGGQQLYITSICPQLRILDLGERPVHIKDFLGIEWACKDTLVQLRVTLVMRSRR